MKREKQSLTKVYCHSQNLVMPSLPPLPVGLLGKIIVLSKQHSNTSLHCY